MHGTRKTHFLYDNASTDTLPPYQVTSYFVFLTPLFWGDTVQLGTRAHSHSHSHILTHTHTLPPPYSTYSISLGSTCRCTQATVRLCACTFGQFHFLALWIRMYPSNVCATLNRLDCFTPDPRNDLPLSGHAESGRTSPLMN